MKIKTVAVLGAGAVKREPWERFQLLTTKPQRILQAVQWSVIELIHLGQISYFNGVFTFHVVSFLFYPHHNCSVPLQFCTSSNMSHEPLPSLFAEYISIHNCFSPIYRTSAK